MNIGQSSLIMFSGKIIDTHTHVGTLKGKNYTKDMLDVFTRSELPTQEKDTVEQMYVSNVDVLTGVKDEYNGNKDTLKQFENNKKYEVFAACAPKEGNVENIKKLYQEHPNTFIGLKFHPTIQELSPLDEKYEPYMKFADENKIPCLFHSAVNVDDKGIRVDSNIELSDPTHIYKLAQKHKKTPIVMAHLGSNWNDAHDKALEVLVDSVKTGKANLYADISWVDIGLEHNGYFPENEHRGKEHIVKAIKTLKGIGDPEWKHGDQSYRLMFGSDIPIDRYSGEDKMKEYTTFIDDIKYAIRNDEDLKKDSEQIIDDLFYNNAKKLYGNKPVDTSIKATEKASKMGKAGKITAAIIGTAAIAIAGIAAVAKLQNSKK